MFKNRIMMRVSLLIVGLLLVAGSSAFIVQKAIAGNCFTDVANDSWLYSATCWMKDKGISTGIGGGLYAPSLYITRGEMAVMFQRAFSNTILESYLTTGPTGWEANDAYPNAFTQSYYVWGHLHNNVVGSAMFQLSPTIPTSLYKTMMYAKGVKICFIADPTAYITSIELKHIWYTTSGYTEINSVFDGTDRNTTGCATVNFASPQGMWGADQVTVMLTGTFSNTANPIYIGTTSLVIYPSTNMSVLGLDDLEAAAFDRANVAPVEYDPASGLP